MDGMIRSLQGEPEKLTPEVAVFSGCNVTNGKAGPPGSVGKLVFSNQMG